MFYRCPSLSCPLDSLPPGGWGKITILCLPPGGKLSRDILPPTLVIFTPRGQAVQAGLSCPRPTQVKIYTCHYVIFQKKLGKQHSNSFMQVFKLSLLPTVKKGSLFTVKLYHLGKKKPQVFSLSMVLHSFDCS